MNIQLEKDLEIQSNMVFNDFEAIVTEFHKWQDEAVKECKTEIDFYNHLSEAILSGEPVIHGIIGYDIKRLKRVIRDSFIKIAKARFERKKTVKIMKRLREIEEAAKDLECLKYEFSELADVIINADE